MANLYWNPPSIPANFSDGNNWRDGSISGPVYGSAPSSADNIYFLPTGSPTQCTFDMNVSVNLFLADDSGGEFVVAPAYANAIQITVSNSFDIRTAGTLQKSFFSLWSTFNDAPVVTLRTTPPSGGATSILIGNAQMGTIFVDGPVNSTTIFSSYISTTIYPFKCYVLELAGGNAVFSVADCDGAHLGLPTNTNPARDAVKTSGSLYKKLDAQFDSSKPIILYGNFNAAPPGGGVSYDLVWASSTRIYAKGPVSQITISALPTLVFGSQIVEDLPFVYNYLGEDASGSSVGPGGNLVLNALTGAISGDCKISLYGLTCTAAGSVSGFYSRGVRLASSSFNTTFVQITSGLSPTFVMTGAPSYQVTFRSTNSPYPGKLQYFNPADTTVQTFYTTLQDIAAQAFSSTLYLAYTDDGNIDGGGNTNWIFQQSKSGFLAFFF